MTAPLQPWLSRDQLEAEIRSLRQAHNFAPAGILNDLVWGIRTEVLEMDFDRALQKMTPRPGLSLVSAAITARFWLRGSTWKLFRATGALSLVRIVH